MACPDDVEQEEGGTFECTVTAPDGTTAPVRVVQKDGEGNVRWNLGQPEESTTGTDTTP